MLLNTDQRTKLFQHNVYKDTKPFWDGSVFNTYKSTGNIPYLLSMASKGNHISFEEWASFYENSGQHRQDKLLGNRDNSSLQLYFGRTQKDIYDISLEFRQHLMDEGFSPEALNDIPDYILFNLTYLRIVDLNYRLFVRQALAVRNLNDFGDQRVYHEIPDPDIVAAINVDIIVKERKSNKIISGIRLRRSDQFITKTEQDIANDKKSINLYNFEPHYLKVGINGVIEDKMPVYDRELRKVW